MSKKRVWHRGPPPHVGWWNASNGKMPNFWRWWNGQNWSAGLTGDASAELVSMLADTRDESVFGIEWTSYYPANARVPRVAP